MNCKWTVQLLWHTILEVFNPSSFRVDDNSLQFCILRHTSVKTTLQRCIVRMIFERLSLQDAFAKCCRRNDKFQVTVSPVYGDGHFVALHSPENIVTLYNVHKLHRCSLTSVSLLLMLLGSY